MAQRVYLIFKIDELNSVQNTKLVDKIHILRLNKKQNGIVLEPWLKFKSNYKDFVLFIQYYSVLRIPQVTKLKKIEIMKYINMK